MLRLDLSGLKIHICERVKLIDHDIDIIRPDTMAKTHDRFTLVCTAYSVELTRRNLKGLRIEKRSHHINATGVSDKDNAVGQLLGKQMQMKHGAI